MFYEVASGNQKTRRKLCWLACVFFMTIVYNYFSYHAGITVDRVQTLISYNGKVKELYVTEGDLHVAETDSHRFTV